MPVALISNELISCADRYLQEIWELCDKLKKKTYNTGWWKLSSVCSADSRRHTQRDGETRIIRVEHTRNEPKGPQTESCRQTGRTRTHRPLDRCRMIR